MKKVALCLVLMALGCSADNIDNASTAVNSSASTQSQAVQTIIKSMNSTIVTAQAALPVVASDIALTRCSFSISSLWFWNREKWLVIDGFESQWKIDFSGYGQNITKILQAIRDGNTVDINNLSTPVFQNSTDQGNAEIARHRNASDTCLTQWQLDLILKYETNLHESVVRCVELVRFQVERDLIEIGKLFLEMKSRNCVELENCAKLDGDELKKCLEGIDLKSDWLRTRVSQIIYAWGGRLRLPALKSCINCAYEQFQTLLGSVTKTFDNFCVKQ